MTRRSLAAWSLLAAALGAGASTVSTASTASPPGRLVLIGGGPRPPEAMARFVEWAGGPAARALVVAWASIEPVESCAAVCAELASHGAGETACAPDVALDGQGRARPLDGAGRAHTLGALARATGVFFTGGDQARIMDVLADEALLAALRERHRAGVVFGGTSAGTAIMSPLMIVGEGDFSVIDGEKVEVRAGLGLLPGVVLDQHFVRRQRENRLFGLVLARPQMRGVGIDEGAALLVSDGEGAEVVGAGPVMVIDARGEDQLLVTLVRPGGRLDLRRRP